jgi:hypothetical protein
MSFTNQNNRTGGRYALDLIERILATAAEAGIGVIVVESAGWPAWVAVPVGAGAAVVKGWVAKWVGNKDSASLASGV